MYTYPYKVTSENEEETFKRFKDKDSNLTESQIAIEQGRQDFKRSNSKNSYTQQPFMTWWLQGYNNEKRKLSRVEE